MPRHKKRQITTREAEGREVLRLLLRAIARYECLIRGVLYDTTVRSVPVQGRPVSYSVIALRGAVVEEFALSAPAHVMLRSAEAVIVAQTRSN